MDVDWTEEQRSSHDAAVRFAQRELNDEVGRRDAECALALDAWRRCAAFGIQGLAVPPTYGGQGADPVTIAAALEGLGYGCRDNGLLFSLNAQMWSTEIPILRYGTSEQRQRWLPGLCDGSLVGAQAMTEPGSGSDAFSLTTTAVQRDGGWVLNGSKAFVTNAPLADVFVVFASTDRRQRFAGVSAFLVERGAPGLTVGPPLPKMGLRTSPVSEIGLVDCGVADDAMLGGPGAGMAIFTTAMDWERSFILVPAVGTMRRQVELCVSYARERHQFGQPIGKFQAVSTRIVDMVVRLETATLLVHRLAARRAAGKATSSDAALAKLYVSECFVQSSLDAVQVHGGSGYLAELEFERDVRDAVGSRIYSGTSEMQRNIVARSLGL